MSERRKRGRRVLIQLVVSAALIVVLVQLVSWRTVGAGLARLPAWTFAAVVAGFLATHFVATLKWRLVVGAAGARIGVVDALECYAAGLFSNVFLPSIVGGDVLRALLAGRRSGRMEAAVLGGAADRLVDFAALGVLAGVGGIFVGFAAPGALRMLLVLAIVLAAIGAAAFVPFALRRPLARWPARMRRRVALVLIALRRQWRRPGVLALAFCGSCALQGALVLLNLAIGRALGIEASLPAWAFAWALAKVAGLLPVSFNGLGVRDAAFTTLFVPLMAGSLGAVEKGGLALAASLCWQAVLLAGSLLAGLAWAWLKRLHPAAPVEQALPQHV